MSTRKRLIFRALVVLTGLIGACVVPEVVMRMVLREEEVDGGYWGVGAFQASESVGYLHAAGFEGYAVRKGEFVCPVRINASNLRQQNLEAQLQYPTKLLILGDSFPFGLGVREEESFASLIQSDLNAIDVGVINGAQAGWYVAQERLFGMQLVERLRPQLVVLSLFADNDVPGGYARPHENITVAFGYRVAKDRWLPIAPVDYLRTHSYLWLFVETELRRIHRREQRQALTQLALENPREFVQPTVDELVMLRDYCEDRGILLGVLMIPPREGATGFDDSIAAAMEAEDIHILNLQGFDQDDFFAGDGHWNVHGHEKAARQLVPFVHRLVRLRRDGAGP